MYGYKDAVFALIHPFVICVSFYMNNKGITHVSELSSIIYCMSQSLHVFLLITITMNEDLFNNG